MERRRGGYRDRRTDPGVVAVSGEPPEAAHSEFQDRLIAKLAERTGAFPHARTMASVADSYGHIDE